MEDKITVAIETVSRSSTDAVKTLSSSYSGNYQQFSFPELRQLLFYEEWLYGEYVYKLEGLAMVETILNLVEWVIRAPTISNLPYRLIQEVEQTRKRVPVVIGILGNVQERLKPLDDLIDNERQNLPLDPLGRSKLEASHAMNVATKGMDSPGYSSPYGPQIGISQPTQARPVSPTLPRYPADNPHPKVQHPTSSLQRSSLLGRPWSSIPSGYEYLPSNLRLAIHDPPYHSSTEPDSASKLRQTLRQLPFKKKSPERENARRDLAQIKKAFELFKDSLQEMMEFVKLVDSYLSSNPNPWVWLDKIELGSRAVKFCNEMITIGQLDLLKELFTMEDSLDPNFREVWIRKVLYLGPSSVNISEVGLSHTVYG